MPRSFQTPPNDEVKGVGIMLTCFVWLCRNLCGANQIAVSGGCTKRSHGLHSSGALFSCTVVEALYTCHSKGSDYQGGGSSSQKQHKGGRWIL